MSAARFEDQRADLRPLWPVLRRSLKTENTGKFIDRVSEPVENLPK
jgi:hypothetical protein